MMFIGTSAVVAAKVAGIVASTYVAWTTYATMPTTELRRNIMKAFRAGELGKKVKRGWGKNAKDVILHPTIQRVSVSLDHKQVVFTVPTGMNPKEVYEHDWLFQQVFGEHIELSGTVKTFALNVYNEGISIFAYNDEEAAAACKGMVLPIYVGRSRTGPIAYDMTEHPHLLIAGETGSGKSVELRSILATLIRLAGDRLELYGEILNVRSFICFEV